MSVFERGRGEPATLLPLLLTVLLAVGGTSSIGRRNVLSRMLLDVLGQRELNALTQEIRTILAQEMREHLLQGVQDLRSLM